MTPFQSYEEENITYWTRRTPGYSSVNQEELSTQQRGVWSELLSERIQARYPGCRPEDIRVLDVGTGPGFFAIILAEMGYRITAVDYTVSMLEAARRNAGTLGRRISFRQMNAEALDFPDGTFDVVVSRNLTWNLPHPENAYSQWNRVLKPGGLLLNFDANWYSYLRCETAREAHLQDRENIRQAGVGDETAGTDVAAMEAIALQAPLSGIRRPAWDRDTLQKCGMHPTANEQIWKRVWTEEERINNASTPMFMIEAVKKGAVPLC